MIRVKRWEDLEPGTLFKTRRGAEGKAVLVDPRDWSEKPFDPDVAVFVDHVECGEASTTAWYVPAVIEASSETELE